MKGREWWGDDSACWRDSQGYTQGEGESAEKPAGADWSAEDRRVRYVSKYRSDQKNEHMKGLYVIANQRGDPKKAFQKKSDE